jgi:DNA adenine methylase
MWAYIGGKKMHSKWIDPLFPEKNSFDTYVEVFGGANWMYWMSKKTPVNTNVYNDFNRHLVNVFECSKDIEKFHDVLLNYYQYIGNSNKFEEFRDEVLDIFHDKFAIPDYTLAAKYMFVQTQIFSGNTGIGRTSKMYHYDDYKSKFITYTEKFTQPRYVDKLPLLTTENMDCRDLIRKYDSPTTFFYVDPPYFNLENYYTKNEFGRDDHIELLTQLCGIRGKFALSYYYFKELEDIMPRDKFYWHEQETNTINGLAKVDGSDKKIKAPRIEILIMNYQPPKILFDDLFVIGDK